MPRAPRGKRVVDPATGSYVVVGRAPNGEPDPYFNRTRKVWVAPWRKPDGKVGRPTGKTRAAAVASRDRHIAAAAEADRFAPLAEGFSAASTLADLIRWWLDNVARHRVRTTTFATYEKQLRAAITALGEVPVRQLRAEQIAAFVSELIDTGSASRARNIRTLLVQVLDEAVNLGLADENVAKKVRSPRVPKVTRRSLSPDEVRRLLTACDERFVAAVALCYVQGWRVSEALGLAWQDIDLEEGTARLRRGSTYADGIGMVPGPPKTKRTAGRQMLGPTVVALLAARKDLQATDRATIGAEWPTTTYEGEQIDLVFTTPAGTPMLRQHVDRAIRKAGKATDLDPSTLGTHTGRRSVVTNLHALGDFDIEDIAKFVGHTDTATTLGYVQAEGDRPQQVSQRALKLLDPGDED